jgi:hypothetical protein
MKLTDKSPAGQGHAATPPAGETCPHCKTGTNSPEHGGNDKCFHCGSCGYIGCDTYGAPPPTAPAALDREARPQSPDLVTARGQLATAHALLRLTPTDDRDKSVERAIAVDAAVADLERAVVAAVGDREARLREALKQIERVAGEMERSAIGRVARVHDIARAALAEPRP